MKKLKEIRGMGVTVYLDIKTIEALDKLGEKIDRSRSWIVNKALRERLSVKKETVTEP